jgi:hypothetical protein
MNKSCKIGSEEGWLRMLYPPLTTITAGLSFDAYLDFPHWCGSISADLVPIGPFLPYSLLDFDCSLNYRSLEGGYIGLPMVMENELVFLKVQMVELSSTLLKELKWDILAEKRRETEEPTKAQRVGRTTHWPTPGARSLSLPAQAKGTPAQGLVGKSTTSTGEQAASSGRQLSYAAVGAAYTGVAAGRPVEE